MIFYYGQNYDNYGNSFPERKSIRFQKKKRDLFPESHHAHVYSTEARNYPAYLAYPTPNAMLNAQCIMLNGMPVKVR